MLPGTVIGVDLDNTLVCYDELFHSAACEEGLIELSLPKSKEAIRNAIRALPGGEARWTRLQALVYGPRMSAAELFDGIEPFFQKCVAERAHPVIVSHKTQFAVLDGDVVDLRKSALGWLEENGFFSDFALSPEDVFFESTRSEKIERIRSLSCSHFVDDLVEVFAAADFPRATEKLLFAPHGGAPDLPECLSFRTWADISHYLFP